MRAVRPLRSSLARVAVPALCAVLALPIGCVRNEAHDAGEPLRQTVRVQLTFAGGSIAAGAPLINGHMYTVYAVNRDWRGVVTSIVLRNPWGVDGIGNDGNPNDGFVTVTAGQLFGSTGRVNWGRV